LSLDATLALLLTVIPFALALCVRLFIPKSTRRVPEELIEQHPEVVWVRWWGYLYLLLAVVLAISVVPIMSLGKNRYATVYALPFVTLGHLLIQGMSAAIHKTLIYKTWDYEIFYCYGPRVRRIGFILLSIAVAIGSIAVWLMLIR